MSASPHANWRRIFSLPRRRRSDGASEGAATDLQNRDRGAALSRLIASLKHFLVATRREISSFLASFTIHALLLITLAMITLAAHDDRTSNLLSLESGDQTTSAVDELAGGDGLDDEPSSATGSPSQSSTFEPLELAGVGTQGRPANQVEDDGQRAASPGGSGGSDLLTSISQGAAGSLSGRSGANRGRLGALRGATPQSELAVQRGLRWLAAHQLPDGSWNFNHDLACKGLCRNPGSAATTTGATGAALLAFLGAGQTHRAGDFRDIVARGLYYLESRMLKTAHGGDLQEGTMYAQGLATIALCEAYAMTEDQRLKRVAQSAIDFIVYAQDLGGGGWRYVPGQPGDTTVTGWQLMALKSAQMGYLRVPPDTLVGAKRFLDSVASEGGAFYGYQSPEKRPACTAIGLLSRMFGGWDHDHPPLAHGVAYLAKLGPASDDMYFNYYATQVLHHFEGDAWEEWNPKMRDFLIMTQETSGHENGSWYFDGGDLRTGGRLINTALAIMTLEVYYRYMPLYTRVALDEEF